MQMRRIRNWPSPMKMIIIRNSRRPGGGWGRGGRDGLYSALSIFTCFEMNPLATQDKFLWLPKTYMWVYDGQDGN